MIGRENILPRGWKISFDIKPTGVTRRWSNILHATVGDNYGGYGDRIPGIWFNSKSTELRVCASLNENPNQCFPTSTPLPLNKYSTIVVQQTQNAGNRKFYNFEVFVNGKLEIYLLNKKPRIFNNVKYYLSDPWYESAKGSVKNYKLKKLEEKEGEGMIIQYYYLL